MGFECASNRCDWLAIVWDLACYGGGMVEWGVILFDVLPHEFTRREGWGSDGVGKRGEPLVPDTTLNGLWAILGMTVVLVEGDGCKGG